jgi:hypothetical protein
MCTTQGWGGNPSQPHGQTKARERVSCRDCYDVHQSVIQGPAVEVGQKHGSWQGSKLGMGLIASCYIGIRVG